jgi:DNA polymerase-3 subunit delta
MKITGRDIDSFLAKPPPNLAAVLIYGHDQGLIKERSQIIAKHYVPDLNDPFSVINLSGDSIAKDTAALIDSAFAIPAMGGYRLVQVDQGESTCLDAMKTLLAKPPQQSLTIITGAEELNTKSALVKLFEQSDQAAAIGCYADTSQSLGKIAQDMFRQHQISVDAAAMDFIRTHLGADRMASRSEIDKLILLAGPEGSLSFNQVSEALGDGASVTVNDTVHAAASGDIKGLSTALNRIKHDAVPGERVIRSAQMYFHKIFRIAAEIEAGASREQAMNSTRPPIFFSEKPMVEKHLRSWTAPRSRRAIDRLMLAEKQSRQGISSDTAAAQALIALALTVKR